MEKESRIWDSNRTIQPVISLPYPNYSIAIAIQKRTQSWRLVPAGIVKPYAFSTISDLIQIVAMLGMHWVAFDQAVGNIVAEGNGLVLTSALVQGLGMLVTFTFAVRHQDILKPTAYHEAHKT
jgi:hypothetical protein